MTARRLLWHDWLLVSNGIAEMAASWRDRLLFGVAALIGIGWLTQSAHVQMPAVPDWASHLVLALIFVAAAGNTLSSKLRLRNFVDQSLLCADALCRQDRFSYRFAYQVPLAVAAVVLICVLRWPAPDLMLRVAEVVGAVAIGTVLPDIVAAASSFRPVPLKKSVASASSVARQFADRSDPLWVVVAEQQTSARSKRAALAIPIGLAIGVAVLTGFVEHLAGPVPGALFLGVCTLGGSAALTRVDDEVVRFTTFAGFGPLVTLSTYLIPAGIFWLTLTVIEVLAAPQPLRIAAITVGLALLTTIFVSFRVWSYRFRSRQAADLIVRADICAAALLGSAAPPLAVAWIILRGVANYRAARDATWLASQT